MTGSLINHLQGSSKQPKPQLDMGATILMWTDRLACTIIKINRTGTKLKVQLDNALRTDTNGMSDQQSYRYERNLFGSVHEFSLRKNGKWVEVGQRSKGGTCLVIGHRDHYYDYSY